MAAMGSTWRERTGWGRFELAVRALLFVFLALWGAAAITSPGPGGSPVGMAITYVLLLIAAVVVRRHVAFGTVLGAASGLVQLLWVPSFNPTADVLMPYVFHALGSHSDARWRRFGLWAAAAATVLSAAIVTPQLWPAQTTGLTERLARFVTFAIATGAFSLGGWSAGYMRWQRQVATEARISAQIAQVEAERLEAAGAAAAHRERIATEMHDVVAHSFAVVAAQADGARYTMHHDPAQAEAALDIIGDTARSAISDLRRILHELRYEEPDGGSADAEQLASTIERLQASGMDLRFTQAGEHPGHSLTSVTMQRILVEALTNALKYADLSKPVHLDLDWDRRTATLRNAVTPHDHSAPASIAESGTGHGIIGMRQRAAVLGGRASAGRREDEWVVSIDLSGENT